MPRTKEMTTEEMIANLRKKSEEFRNQLFTLDPDMGALIHDIALRNPKRLRELMQEVVGPSRGTCHFCKMYHCIC